MCRNQGVPRDRVEDKGKSARDIMLRLDLKLAYGNEPIRVPVYMNRTTPSIFSSIVRVLWCSRLNTNLESLATVDC